MIVIDSEDNLDIGKIYTGLWLQKDKNSINEFFENPYKVVKKASLKEYIISCREDNIDPYPIEYNNFYWIYVD